MNKQELNNFLDKNINEIGNFALVTFDNKTIPIYFSRQNYNGEAWFMESPCEVYKFDFPVMLISLIVFINLIFLKNNKLMKILKNIVMNYMNVKPKKI